MDFYRRAYRRHEETQSRPVVTFRFMSEVVLGVVKCFDRRRERLPVLGAPTALDALRAARLCAGNEICAFRVGPLESLSQAYCPLPIACLERPKVTLAVQ